MLEAPVMSITIGSGGLATCTGVEGPRYEDDAADGEEL